MNVINKETGKKIIIEMIDPTTGKDLAPKIIGTKNIEEDFFYSKEEDVYFAENDILIFWHNICLERQEYLEKKKELIEIHGEEEVENVIGKCYSTWIKIETVENMNKLRKAYPESFK